MTTVGAVVRDDDGGPSAPKTVSKSQFRSRALAYLRDGEETGEALILTDHGSPVLRIAPNAPAEEAPAALRGCVACYAVATVPVGVDE